MKPNAAVGPSSAQRGLTNPTGDNAMAPELAETATGAVLTWIEPHPDGHALRFAAFDGRGFESAGTIAAGADWFVNWADTPRLFVTPGGDWIAHWLVKSGSATYAYDVMASRSSDQGETWSPPAVPHEEGTQTEHGFVSYFADIDGTAHLVWLDGRYTGGGHNHHAHEGHDSDRGAMTLRTASMVGASFAPSLELDARVCDCCPTASAVTDEGPIVVYRDRSTEEIRDISIVRRTAAGWTPPAPVAVDGWTMRGCPVNGPDVVAVDNRVAVAWFTMANDIPRVRLALSTDAGRSFDSPRSFSEEDALGRVQLSVVEGGVLMLWMETVQDAAALRLARVNWDGNVRWSRRLIGLDPGRGSGLPRMAVLDERILLAWTVSAADEAHPRATRVETALIDLK